MDLQLNPIEIRVLGCLIEKEMATPDYYPLTLNALLNACSQRSNRNPIMELEEATLIRTLDTLRMEHHLAIESHSSSSRVSKYKHNLPENWSFSPAQTAILCELFIRGPQTPGDLRAHASRLHPLTDCHEVEKILSDLESRDDGPFVIQLPREPGRRERRWAHLFSGKPRVEDHPADSMQASTHIDPLSANDTVESLEKEISDLRQELDALKEEFTQFKTAFE